MTFHAQREERGIFAEGMDAGLKNYYNEDIEDDHRRFAEALSDPAALDVLNFKACYMTSIVTSPSRNMTFSRPQLGISPKSSGGPSLWRILSHDPGASGR